MTNPQSDGAKLWSVIKDLRFAMLTTSEQDGTLNSRPMASSQDSFDGTLRFLTSASSHKVEDIRQDRDVNVSYSDPDSQTFVSVSGRARLTRDRAKAQELWSPVAKVWFPKGLDDPDLAVIEIAVKQAEYWDGADTGFGQAVALIKASLTGDGSSLGDNEKLSFSTGGV
ncbi:MAG: pyridoxamine 5'-phosphate oxidase family protein [Inquilinaceae bacterium]